MQPWPTISSLEPKKMHNVRMPVEVLASLRTLSDAMPGWSVTDFIIIGSILMAQIGARPIGRDTMQALTPARLARNAMEIYSSPAWKQLERALKAARAEAKKPAKKPRRRVAKKPAKKGAK